MVLAHENSPAFVQGLFDLVTATYQSIDKESEALRTGRGLTWADHVPELFEGTERTFAPGYRTHLVEEWIPALTGVADTRLTGGRVADVGCGRGTSTLLMARAFPKARVVGFDYHAPRSGSPGRRRKRPE